MTAKTASAAWALNRVNDGRDDPHYMVELAHNQFEGRRQCLLLIMGIGLLGFILSSLLHLALFKALGEWAAPINFWITFPTLGLVLWGVGIILVLLRWQLWVIIHDNHSWVLVNMFPGATVKEIKFPQGTWFIPPWWWPKPENYTNHEDQTITLPEKEHSAREGKGTAVVGGASFTYFVPFSKAEKFVMRDKTVIAKRLVEGVESRIGPVIAGHPVETIVGQSTLVTRDVTNTFLGADMDDIEEQCDVHILSVTIGSVKAGTKTQEQMDKDQAAVAQANRMKSLLAVVENSDGTPITDHRTRADRMRLAGIDPGRTIADDQKIIRHEADENVVDAAKGLGEGFAQGLAMIASIVGGVKEIKGEPDKGKRGKKKGT